MNFVVDSGPHIKDKDHTSKIMRRLLIALLPIIVFSIYKNGLIPYQNGYINFYEAVRPILIILLASVTSLVTEILFIRLVLKKRGSELGSHIKHSYAIFPGLFLALIIPINTPIWLVIMGSMFATVIGKMLFGGFGYNVFNPGLVGGIFVTSSYGALIASRGGYLNGQEIDTITKATPLTNLSNLNFVGSWGEIGAEFGTMWDYLFGFIPGAIGETSKLLILIAMIFLIATKVIKWRIPIIYILTVFIMTLIIGTYNEIGIWYPAFQVLSGGLLFGAVFMATDPVTSPVTKTGQVIFGLGLGILTVMFRFLTPYPEGVLTAILTMNMLVFIIDRTGAKAKFNFKTAILPLIVIISSSIGVSLYIGNAIAPREIVDTRVNITDVKKQGEKTIYNATTKAFVGLIKAEVIIEGDRLTKITIIDQNESYWQEIENHKYINKLIDSQDKITEVDTISGATVTSAALKLMIIKILEDYEKEPR